MSTPRTEDSQGDIVLPYKFKLSKGRLTFNFVICVVMPTCFWLALWAIHHSNTWVAQFPEGQVSRWDQILWPMAVLFTACGLATCYSMVRHRLSSEEIVLGEKGLTLPVGFSMRQVYVRYADIERINKKSLGANRALGNNAFSNQVVRSLTVLQLIHRGGKVVIVVEMLKSRADVDLIIRTCETRRGPAHKPLILPPVNFRF